MSIQFFKPKSELLDKYINGFYFISENDILTSKKYWTFPNNFCLVTICLDAKIISEEKKITIQKSTFQKTESYLFYNVSTPVEIDYKVPINEVTIYFKPLGIFHFFPDVLMSANSNHIEHFKPFSDYFTELQKILKMDNKNVQAKALEVYFLSKFHYKRNEMAQDILEKIEAGWKVNDVANELNISRQYLNRIFFRYVGKSPSMYKKIHRFRQIISSNPANEKFISISHENLFFDQPHFNREFKTLTGVVPTSFFKNVDTSNEKLWFFI